MLETNKPMTWKSAYQFIRLWFRFQKEVIYFTEFYRCSATWQKASTRLEASNPRWSVTKRKCHISAGGSWQFVHRNQQKNDKLHPSFRINAGPRLLNAGNKLIQIRLWKKFLINLNVLRQDEWMTRLCDRICHRIKCLLCCYIFILVFFFFFTAAASQ